MKNEFVIKCCSTFFGLGCVPKAPGTAGSLGAALLYVVLGAMGLLSWQLVLGVTIMLALVSIWIAYLAIPVYGRSDPQVFVLDEVAGFFVSCLFLQSYNFVLVAILGFILFRVFDIMKPFMVRSAERLPGGFGIVCDDLIAGLMANVVLQMFFVFVI